jgi:hypothetical protein
MYSAETTQAQPYPEEILKSQVMRHMEDPLYRSHAAAFAEANSTKEDDPLQTIDSFIIDGGSMLAIKETRGANPYDSTKPLSPAVRDSEYVFVSGKVNPNTHQLEMEERAITVPAEYTPSYLVFRDHTWSKTIFEIEGGQAALAPDEHPADIQWLASKFGSSASMQVGFGEVESMVLLGEPTAAGEGNTIGIGIEDTQHEIHEMQESAHGAALEAEKRADQALQAKVAMPAGKAILGKLVASLGKRFQEQHTNERAAAATAARDAYLASLPGRRSEDI